MVCDKAMRLKTVRTVLAAGLSLWFLLGDLTPACADKIRLKVRVGNRTDKSWTKEVRVNLPPGIGTNEVINLDGMELRYDVKNDLYYVYKNVELAPKDLSTEFNVEFKDIWTIPASALDELQKHAEALAAILKKNPEQAATGEALKAEVLKRVEKIRESQAANSIRAGVATALHIKAYEADMAELDSATKMGIRMENLVLGMGEEPGKLLTDIKPLPLPKRPSETASNIVYKTFVLSITVSNKSPDITRSDIVVSYHLPPELSANDVLDSAGLEIRTDIKKNVCTLYSNRVTLAPGMSATYNVKLRDKWNINGPRFGALRAGATNLQERVKSLGKYKSVEEKLVALIADLDALAQERGPESMGGGYIEFYRRQGDRLDAIEQEITRIDNLLKPILSTTPWGFKVMAPSRQTTWIIIYIILGFLAFLSLVFFFRWYAKTKAEKLTDEK